MYKIFENEKEFVAKNAEIMEAGLFPNSEEYANLIMCKHPTLNKWAMPIVTSVEHLFYGEITKSLTSDWFLTIKK